MCLIAHRPKPGAHIPNEVININRWMNPDGFGLMWRDAELIRYQKYAPDEFEFFRNQLKALDVTDVEYAAHWRNATAGDHNREMAHPYEYTDASGTPIVAMHNGIINIKTSKEESDTYAFVHQVLAKLATGWWDDPALRFLVEQAVGWSRLLLFTPAETVYINRDEWKVEDAVTYSTEPMPGTVYAGHYVTNKKKGTSYPPTIWDGNEYDGFDYPDVFPDDPATWEPVGDIVKQMEKDIFTKPVVWFHDDHLIEPLEPLTNADITEEEDLIGSIVCTECETEGEFYVIDGKVYAEMTHEKPKPKGKPKGKVKGKKKKDNGIGFIPLPEGKHIPTGEPAAV